MLKKYWFRIVVIILICLLSFKIYTKLKTTQNENGQNQKDRKGAPVSVKIQSVSIRDLSEQGIFSGTVLAGSSLTLAPKVSGQLIRLKVNIGDKVQKNQLLGEIDPRTFVQDFEKAKASLDIAQANATLAKQAYEVAKKEMANQKSLLSQNYISQNEFDKFNTEYINLQSKFKIAQANINSAKAELANAELNLNETKIKAEWEDNGTYRFVGEKYTNEGTMLNKGSSILSLVDISHLLVRVYISEKDYPLIKKGMSAQISSDLFPDKKFSGKVAHIAPVLQESNRQALVEIEINNPELLLKPGMYVNIGITYHKKEQILCAPMTAIYDYKGEKGVFTYNKQSSTVDFIPVITGISDGLFIEIASPEISGDVVILGQDQLSPGKKVSLPKPDKSTKKSKK